MGQVAVRSHKPRRNRRALGLVLLVLALAVLTAAGRSLWRRGVRRDGARLDLLYAAVQEFNARRYDRAIELLDRRSAEVTPTPLDWMLRARIAESRGELALALGHLEQIPDTATIAAQARLKAGQLERKRYRARAAEAALRRAQALDGDLIQSYRELAYLFALQRRKSECDAQFRTLARRVPLDHVLAFAWCQNTCDLWDPYASGDVLRSYVEADPDDRASRLALATSYQLTTRPEEALAALEALPESDPDARAIRTRIAIDRGDIAAARELAGTGPPDHARLNVLRGQLALFGNEPARAAEFYRVALGADPDDRDAIQGLGLALRRLGDPEGEDHLRLASRFDQLKRMIQDSVSTLRTDPRLFAKLGGLCEALDRPAEARAWYHLAIGRDPLDSEAQQALARIDLEHPDLRPAAPSAPAEPE
jgi:predicted Zn-dependent protease